MDTAGGLTECSLGQIPITECTLYTASKETETEADASKWNGSKALHSQITGHHIIHASCPSPGAYRVEPQSDQNRAGTKHFGG